VIAVPLGAAPPLMPRTPKSPPEETSEQRWEREAQTARNLEGLTAEQEGRLDDAIALYERNAAEGFEGDWPYGRLLAIYEKREAFDDAERIILRAIEVFQTGQRRTPQDRRSLAQLFRRRLTLVKKARAAAVKRGRIT